MRTVPAGRADPYYEYLEVRDKISRIKEDLAALPQGRPGRKKYEKRIAELETKLRAAKRRIRKKMRATVH